MSVASESRTKTTRPSAVSPQKRAENRFSRKPFLWSVFLVAAIGVGGWGAVRHPAYREWQIRQMPLAALTELQKKQPNDPMVLYHLGTRLNQAGRFAEAVPVLNQAAGLQPDSARIRDAWASALVNLGEVTPAFGQLKQFVGTYPDSAEGHLALGKFYFSQRAMENAVAELEAALKVDPRLAEAYSFMAAAQEALGQMERARQTALKAVEMRPDNATDRLLLASLQERLNQPDEAAKSYARAAEIAKTEAPPHRQYARWLLLHGKTADDWKRAETAAHRAVELDSKDADAHLFFARALLRQKRSEEAMPVLMEAAELAKNDPAAPRELVTLLRNTGKDAEAARWEKELAARQAFEDRYKQLFETLRTAPKDRKLHREMADLLASRGEAVECQRHTASELNRPVDSVQTLVATAERLRKNNHPREALPLAFRAVQIARYNPNAHETLADVYTALDMPYQAGVEYNEAARLVPSRFKPITEKINAYMSKREKNPLPAEIAYRQSLALERSQIGPQTVNEEVEKLAKRATELDPYNPKYWWHLMNVQMTLKKTPEALQSGDTLLKIAPEFRKGHALMAVLLADTAATEADFQKIEGHLASSEKSEKDQDAEDDPTVDALKFYGQGLLALKRGDGKTAAVALREAAMRDPEEPITYYKLSQAERLAGNTQAADNALKLFQLLQADRKAQADALSAIAQNPDNPALYENAARIFTEHELPEQAEAIRAEARRRFGKSGKPVAKN